MSLFETVMIVVIVNTIQQFINCFLMKRYKQGHDKLHELIELAESHNHDKIVYLLKWLVEHEETATNDQPENVQNQSRFH